MRETAPRFLKRESTARAGQSSHPRRLKLAASADAVRRWHVRRLFQTPVDRIVPNDSNPPQSRARCGSKQAAERSAGVADLLSFPWRQRICVNLAGVSNHTPQVR